MDTDEIRDDLKAIFKKLDALTAIRQKVDNHIQGHHKPINCPRMDRHEEAHKEHDRLFWAKAGALAGMISAIAVVGAPIVQRFLSKLWG